MALDLTGVRLKIARAETHLSDLGLALEGYVGRMDAPIGPERSFSRTNVASSVQVLPADLAVGVGDFLSNVRSALDHLAYQIVLHEGLTPDRYTQFPIRDKGPTVISSVEGKVHSPALGLIRQLQPYITGKREENPLWLLDELRNIDTHRTLHLIVSRQHVSLTKVIEQGTPRYQELRLAAGDTFSVPALPDDHVLRIENEFYIEDERPAIGGKPVRALLVGILSHVEDEVLEPVSSLLT